MIQGAVRPRKERIPARAAAILAAALALAAGPRASAAVPLAERLPEAVAEAQKTVEKVRGVSFRGPVASALLREKDLPKILGQKLVEDLPAPFARYAASLAAAGFLDLEPGLEESLTRLYTRQVAGFYDPEVKKFFIVPERTSEAAASEAA